MKNHSQFVDELQTYLHSASIVPLNPEVILTKAIEFSRMGVAPEGFGNNTTNAIVDSIYKLGAPVYQPKPLTPPPETVAPKFVLGARSRGRLQTLKPELAKVVQQAVTLTDVDFTVLETIRTIEEQKAAVASGHSRTMQSLHLQQADGFAWAVDLGAWVNGAVSWTSGFYWHIAFAMDKAATAQGVAQHIRWGGAWDKMLSDFGGSRDAYLAETLAYEKRHAGSDLIDLPHFEWHN